MYKNIKSIDDVTSLPMNPIYAMTDIELAMQNAPKIPVPILKQEYEDEKLSLADYMYSVASHLPVIDYIPEWLVVMDGKEEEVLNIGMSNLSIGLIE